MSERGSLSAPPDIVPDRFLGGTLDIVFADFPQDSEFNRIAKRALADAVASSDNGKAGAEIDADHIAESAKSAHLNIIQLHDRLPRISATSAGFAAPRNA